jgi:hypothetical protein
VALKISSPEKTGAGQLHDMTEESWLRGVGGSWRMCEQTSLAGQPLGVCKPGRERGS